MQAVPALDHDTWWQCEGLELLTGTVFRCVFEINIHEESRQFLAIL